MEKYFIKTHANRAVLPMLLIFILISFVGHPFGCVLKAESSDLAALWPAKTPLVATTQPLFYSADTQTRSQQPDAYVSIAWAELTVKTLTAAPKNSPTYSSRVLGYLGLTMYETVVGTTRSKSYRSIAQQLCDTLQLPKADPKQVYCPELALNAGQAYLLKMLLGYTDRTAQIDSLSRAIHQQYRLKNPADVVERSEIYGQAVAQKIYQWSITDGGHEAYARNFPEDYVQPKGAGYWTPPELGQSISKIPLHPYWGQNRSFVKNNAGLPLPAMIPYSSDSSSLYYQQFKEVYDIQQNLTTEQKEIANWWGDDPLYTAAPPGHSYNIAIIILKNQSSDLTTAALTFAKVGMACADAFINCWRNKFVYFSERPRIFINKNIDKDFVQYWPEPPFPSFPSGHATQMAATAEVLISIFGDKISFIDNTHDGVARRKGIAFKNRHFDNISQIATECGISRLYGGIHTQQDNTVGLAEGKKIGENINRLNWVK